MSRRHFNKYPNKWLVETGTYLGDGIQEALNNNFERVISFEISNELAQKAKEKYNAYMNVTIIHASSAELLGKTIADIKEPITFWLDGHYSMGNTSYDPDAISPLMKELEHISQHPIKTHTIMVDDRRLMVKTGQHGLDTNLEVTEGEVVAKLKQINPAYKIKYENGHVANDIIVATI